VNFCRNNEALTNHGRPRNGLLAMRHRHQTVASTLLEAIIAGARVKCLSGMAGQSAPITQPKILFKKDCMRVKYGGGDRGDLPGQPGQFKGRAVNAWDMTKP
jgi:hypothetical protein